jgi:glutamine amidotransferase
MCLLCFIPPNKWPKKKHLKNACSANPDGFGFAINAGDEIIIRKSMNADEIIEEFYDLRNDYRDCAVMFHARLTTHGTTNIDNCHPFFVAGDRQVVMAHNGILPVLMDTDKQRSDTKIFAEDYMARIGIEALDDPIGLDIISEYCSGNKLVFFSISDKLKEQWYIINEESGVYEKDIWYSNGGYQSWADRTKLVNAYPYYGDKGNAGSYTWANRWGHYTEDYYHDDDTCSVCYRSFDDLEDDKYMNGCKECGLTSSDIWHIYDDMMKEEQDYDEEYKDIHTKPLSLDWSKPLV